jgi:heme/copper-type cytochrome/quinol oxidase subunit 2
MVALYWATAIADNKFTEAYAWYFQGALLISLFIGLIVVFMLFGSSTKVVKRSSKFKRLITGTPVKALLAIMVTIIVTTVMLWHAKMSFELAPDIKEFTQIVHGGPSSSDVITADGHAIVVNNYDGELTDSLKQIDSKISQAGFIRLGEINENDQYFFCLEMTD